jgi:nuclear factor related to kappa-B-binding protein
VYHFGGVKSIVAPMKRVAANSNRAREHYLLKQDRPSHVTLLCLVRDSASRLPGISSIVAMVTRFQ